MIGKKRTVKNSKKQYLKKSNDVSSSFGNLISLSHAPFARFAIVPVAVTIAAHLLAAGAARADEPVTSDWTITQLLVNGKPKFGDAKVYVLRAMEGGTGVASEGQDVLRIRLHPGDRFQISDPKAEVGRNDEARDYRKKALDILYRFRDQGVLQKYPEYMRWIEILEAE